MKTASRSTHPRWHYSSSNQLPDAELEIWRRQSDSKKHETYPPQVGRYAELDLVHTQYGIKRVASSFLSLILSDPFSCFSARGHRPRVNGKSSVTYNCASYAIRCLSTSHTVASWHCRFTSRTHWLHTRPVCPCYCCCCCCCSVTSHLLSIMTGGHWTCHHVTHSPTFHSCTTHPEYSSECWQPPA